MTDRIVAALEAGTRPWQQPWANGAPGAPVNATTGRRYHGINTLILTMTSFALGGDPRFCSYKQAADRGWQVRKGERGTTVFFFKRMLVEDRDAAPDAEDRTKAIPMLRAYTVFCGSQIDGIRRPAIDAVRGVRRAERDSDPRPVRSPEPLHAPPARAARHAGRRARPGARRGAGVARA